jgi:uncharacterized protein (DUF4213/DUF364 family)
MSRGVENMESVIEALVERGLFLAGEARIADVRVGLGYTAVKLCGGQVGVGGMLRYLLEGPGCSLLSYAGTLAGRQAAELVPLLRSENIVEASIGLATVNALSRWEGPAGSTNEDLVELLGIGPHERVGMVGDITPVLDRIRQYADSCFVFDDGKQGEEGITETSLQEEILPQCDVVVLSATSLLNKTFDRLVKLSVKAREICLMGPSTPLIPEVFQGSGVTLLAGRRFTDPDRLLQVVSEAGGTRSFGPLSLKVNIRLKSGNCFKKP